MRDDRGTLPLAAVRVLPVVKDQIHFDLDLETAGLAEFKKNGAKPAFVQAGAKPGARRHCRSGSAT